ncbi:MAG TPA: polyprenol phosphomannose-dependent alpha 1,6 mannosyltransferase MptB [Thermoleophilaceae bacterium]|nr:polyprenol phosphomannose-dependent alpha 1,6 mannosyltransferase MptB [Thermoleophilaceae bacterium]
MLYALMAALPAAPGSDIVLATSGGSPGWLLGPLRFAGVHPADGPLAGPLFYAALWLALILYVVVLRAAAGIGTRLALGAVGAMHVLFLLAPPLLSHDVFSYIAYARLGVANHLNPYTHAPLDIPGDPGFVHAGSIDASSAYGPVFTLLTYPLSPLGVPAAFWILKVVAALSSLGVVALTWKVARRLGRDALVPALAVGLNPLVLVHVVGGAHNEAVTLLLTMAGVLLWVGARETAGVVVSTLAVGIKASAGLVVPFLVVGDIRRRVWPALATLVALALLGVIAFGTHALDALSLISDNQDRTSRFSFPYKTAQLLGALLPGNRLDYRDAVRVAFAVSFAAVFLWLLWRAWRGLIDVLDAIGWATFAILIASAWLVPWYILWLLPFAAISRDRRLQLATLALSAWMLAIAVPL